MTPFTSDSKPISNWVKAAVCCNFALGKIIFLIFFNFLFQIFFDIDCVIKISDKNHKIFAPSQVIFKSSSEITKISIQNKYLKNRWKCDKHSLKCSGWSFPLFLSTLANLSVNQRFGHSHRNSIVASQLTCLMLHCSGHFLQTFCSVSYILYP